MDSILLNRPETPLTKRGRPYMPWLFGQMPTYIILWHLMKRLALPVSANDESGIANTVSDCIRDSKLSCLGERLSLREKEFTCVCISGKNGVRVKCQRKQLGRG